MNLLHGHASVQMIKERRIWLSTGSSFLLLFVSLSTQTHTEIFHTHMLWRAPARWDCLPVYLPRSTQRMTDDHLRHLGRAIVRAPYRTGPSSRRADSPTLLTLLLLFAPFGGAAGSHHTQRAYPSLWKQTRHPLVPVRN